MQDRARLNAAIAATRFGLGARPGELERIGGDARGWLEAQVRAEGAPQPQGSFVRSEERARQFSAYNGAAGQAAQARNQAQEGMAGEADPQAQAADEARRAERQALQQDTAREFLARAQLGARTDAPFAERWALFWANLFTASATKFQSAIFLGPYEREAIRPHVFGRFEELALAAESHPAMLLYLDQAQSIGPNSLLGQRRQGTGLNENLAREILELHTVGADAGYTQADVTEFARALTGWSVPRPRDGRQHNPRVAAALNGEPGPRGFVFRPAQHEPGTRTVLGRAYPQTGLEQGRAIIRDLANHPAAARRLSRRIAAHFVADQPPPPLVARLEQAWTRSRGDLAAVARALIAAPEAWAPEADKVKTPYDFLISTHRALDSTPARIQTLAPTLAAMGQPMWAAPSPEGWPDTAADWAGPDGLVKRLNYAKAVGDLSGERVDAAAIAQGALGPRLSERTLQFVRRAESRPEALTLFLMSPEFQRR